MYFETVSLKSKKPNSGMFRNKVVLINGKTKDVMSFQLGLATDWAYYEARGWTHWVKLISNKKLKNKLCNQ
jgi:hypothetical protein